MLRLLVVWAAAGWLVDGGFLANPTKKKIIQILVLKSAGPVDYAAIICSANGIKEGVCASADDKTNGVAAFQKSTKRRET